ncbi:MAG: hypothetical protein ACRDF4_02735, partial [Rhabdochlamydiaceae bacterium]
RVLKPRGLCYATHYLINDFSSNQIKNKTASQPFKYEFDDFISTHKNRPEQTIAVDEFLIRTFYEAARLKINEPIHYGSWANRKSDLHYQDLIVSRKE